MSKRANGDGWIYRVAAAASGRFGAPLGRDQLKRLRGRLIKAIDQQSATRTSQPQCGRASGRTGDLSSTRAAPTSSSDHRRRTTGATRWRQPSHRRAEARGLRWSRVDLDALTVRVDAQINRQNEIARAKTKRSLRTIRVDATAGDRLAAWWADQLDMEAAAGQAWSGNQQDLIATTAFGTVINQRNVHRSLAAVCRKIGIKPAISGYDLRHTAITLQVEKGHPVHHIAEWAGTSERMIVDVYRHNFAEVSDLGPSDSYQ